MVQDIDQFAKTISVYSQFIYQNTPIDWLNVAYPPAVHFRMLEMYTNTTQVFPIRKQIVYGAQNRPQ